MQIFGTALSGPPTAPSAAGRLIRVEIAFVTLTEAGRFETWVKGVFAVALSGAAAYFREMVLPRERYGYYKEAACLPAVAVAIVAVIYCNAETGRK